MRKVFTTLLILILSITAFSQTVSPFYSSVCAGDTFQLECNGVITDSIFWQENVGAGWANIAAPMDSILTSSCYVTTQYRAMIITMGVSNYSNAVTVYVLSTPLITVVNYTGNSIMITWTPPIPGGASVFWSGASSGSQSSVTPPFTITTLVPGVPICIYVSLAGGFLCSSTFADSLCYSPACIFSLSETHTNTNCATANGSVDLTVTGTTNVTFNWSTGDTTEDINNLSAGIYAVTVTDTTGCFQTLNAIIANTNGPSLTETHTHSFCTSGSGTIDLTATGGVAPYNYSWSNGATTEDLNNLSNGNYSVTVTDQNSCDGFITVTIYDSTFFYFVFISSVTPNCTNNGSLTANQYNGFSPFTYLWDNGQTTQTISGLSGGFYDVTVTDNTGCERTVDNFSLQSSCYNVAEGYAYIDSNLNCIYDVGEVPQNGITICANDGQHFYYGSSDSLGHFSINIALPGTFQLFAYANVFGSCNSVALCPFPSFTFPSTGDTSFGNNLGIHPTFNYDFVVFPFCIPANPGFEKEYIINCFEWQSYLGSNPPFTDTVTVVFNYDSNLTFDSCLNLPPIVDTANHTLTWQVVDINANGYYDTYFHVPANLSLSYLLQSDFSISPTVNDCDTSNNHLHYSEVVTSSLDPNSKEVFPSGNISPEDSILTYTIHFQNTGTDTTHFVILKDTLSEFLNPASVVNLAASAPYSDFKISGTGVLTWTFNPLFLPDSTTNEAASKGFVMFKVKVKQGLSSGTVIQNKASIYFDYNAPVVTNTVSTSIFSNVNEIINENDISVYPNPFDGEFTVKGNNLLGSTIVLSDILGRELLHEQANQNSKIINLNSYPAGVYLLKVISKNGIIVLKKVVKE